LVIRNANATAFTTTFPTNNGSYWGYIVNYNSSGTVQWAVVIANTVNVLLNSLSTDSAGNLYAAGGSSGSAGFYNPNGTLFSTVTLSVSTNAFVAKYNSSGVPQWIKTYGGSNTTVGRMASDSTYGVYLAGAAYSNFSAN
jgi:hypothetical protein